MFLRLVVALTRRCLGLEELYWLGAVNIRSCLVQELSKWRYCCVSYLKMRFPWIHSTNSQLHRSSVQFDLDFLALILVKPTMTKKFVSRTLNIHRQNRHFSFIEQFRQSFLCRSWLLLKIYLFITQRQCNLLMEIMQANESTLEHASNIPVIALVWGV